MKHPLYIIVATDQNNGIGKDGLMPWHLSGEIKHFKKITSQTEDPSKQNIVLMGRTTWESLPEKYRPLQGRKNVILTRNAEYKAEGADVVSSFEEAFSLADDQIEKIFIIGGQKVYEQALQMPQLEGIYQTKIKHSYDCDAFFPALPEDFSQSQSLGQQEERGIEYEFLFYTPHQ